MRLSEDTSPQKEYILNYLMFHMDKIMDLSLIFVVTLVLRQAILICGQKWINTFSHTATLILLPMITYTITSVISGNIALSLGMVGALSIIRFRNPVKSPFELVVYFLVITLGIAAAVSVSWVVFLVGASFVVLTGLALVNKASMIMKRKPLFTTSFTEGNSMNTLEILGKVAIPTLLKNPFLISYINEESAFIYRFASHDRQALLQLSDSFQETDTVTRVTFNAS